MAKGIISGQSAGDPVTSLSGSSQIPLGAGQCCRTGDRAQGRGGQKGPLEFMADGRNLGALGARESLKHIHLYQGLRERRSLRMGLYVETLRHDLPSMEARVRPDLQVCAFPSLVFL